MIFFSRLGTGAGGWGWGKFKFNVNQNENENKNASGGTCEGIAKRPPVGCFTRCVFVFVFVLIYVEFEFSDDPVGGGPVDRYPRYLYNVMHA